MQLELKGITKRFGPLVANDSIDLVVREGEIHALLGENGAGKSTLMNVLYGLYTPDAGQILVDGEPVEFSSPGDAMAAGIGMVHQHFMLVPTFTATENIVLGAELTSGGGFLDRRRARRRVEETSRRFGLAIPADTLVADLAVGVQQRVEIVKALLRDAKVLVLDEPTAVLTPAETDDLMRVMRELADAGTSIVFITHKLREVKAVADRITVIRRGKVVGEASPQDSPEELAALMVGRDVRLRVEKAVADPGESVLQMAGVRVVDPAGTVLLDGIDLDVRAGEVLAVAGVDGNGQTELTRSIVGLQPVESGTVRIAGTDVTGRDIAGVLGLGVGYVPEDRLHDGLVGSFSIAENLVLDLVDSPAFASGLAVDRDAVGRNAAERIAEFDIRTPSAQAAATTLSGGNQQKVVLAREMSRPLKLLVVAQPTRGVDVGSQEFVHQRIVAERDRGAAVLLVSTELDEVRALADRIVVMYRGKVAGEVGPDATQEELGLLMAGATTGKDHA
ncbi:ABC transporter ATP-binding protein [Kineococcus rhizosphaerae]|uniref:Nucleoside ABC transporter ATP-binding protein n=1 Tax=Kineococcus rhizosphaerae TaxID=559628 RepID=A0A2T0R1R6_9ACTN|nr:ABC transporter ATP-binding protein [Kineococcus rhizosphaerae]PRY13461.1 nucleoside ABC transporter ATP-binding protein [Kineococcus rhizosphaerae]